MGQDDAGKEGGRPLRVALQNNVSPELVVELLEKLLPSDSGNGNGKGICEIIFPQSIAFNTGLTIGILRFNKRRALTDAPLRGIFLVPQKNGWMNCFKV